MTYLSEILFLAAIIGIAYMQARMIGAGNAIHHGWWDVIFGVLIAVAWLIFGKNYWLGGALMVEHFVFFPPVLNFLRTPRKAFFYLSSQPHKGSIWDALLLKIEPAYPYLWGAGLSAFVFGQFKL